MDEYQVDLAHLDDVTTKISGLESFLTTSLAEIEERIATVQAAWSGKAADAHAEAHADWAKAGAAVRDGIGEMRAAAAAAHTAYVEVGNTNLRILGRGSSGS
ncbi:WXG100 family type VII secretion target [Nocardia sp. NPDC050712]|uniref:WXG100 family type VII secretion target n=1 Tax=Nocardia sp. NPDC050712 TaxID=3155518 RepID=UPI003410020A